MIQVIQELYFENHSSRNVIQGGSMDGLLNGAIGYPFRLRPRQINLGWPCLPYQRDPVWACVLVPCQGADRPVPKYLPAHLSVDKLQLPHAAAGSGAKRSTGFLPVAGQIGSLWP